MRKASESSSSVYDRLSKPKTTFSSERRKGSFTNDDDDDLKSEHHHHFHPEATRVREMHLESASVKDLAKIVSELKRESLRHLDLETETQTEFEYVNSQMKSTRGAVGKLADIMMEDLESLRSDWKSQLQSYQIDCNQRLADMQNAIERLEFRFAHHLRDCQVMADQVDRTSDSITSLKNQTCEFRIATEKSFENVRKDVGTVQRDSKNAEERAAIAINECTNRMESFQERLVNFSKDMDTQLQESINSTAAKLQESKTVAKRQSAALHHTIEDLLAIRSELNGMSSLKNVVERHQKRFTELLDQNNKCLIKYEHKWNAIEAAVEAHRTKTQHAMHVQERKTSTKLDSFAQTLLFMTQCMKKHSIPPSASTTVAPSG